MKLTTAVSRSRDGLLGLSIAHNTTGPKPSFAVERIEWSDGSRWRRLLMGIPDCEFCTSFGSADADTFQVLEPTDGDLHLELTCHSQDAWHAEEIYILSRTSPWLIRRQTYYFHDRVAGAIHPGWRLANSPDLRYTFPLYAHEKMLADLAAIRADVDWALPFPFHIWHTADWVALYGLDKRVSPGTLDYVPVDDDGFATVRVFYPDRASHKPFSEQICAPINRPESAAFAPDTAVTLTELITLKRLKEGQEPLLEAERLAAELLLSEPRPNVDLASVANKLADFFRHCELWNPNALGSGQGWFHNMWVNTHKPRSEADRLDSLTPWVDKPSSDAPTREWPSACYDLGWGEGVAVETIAGLRRHWQRTGRTDLLVYVDEMTRNIERFKRHPEGNEPYFDRCVGGTFGDFSIAHSRRLETEDRRIWTHSVGHTGYQLITSYLEAPDYPNAATRERWFKAADSIARFLCTLQKPDGDLPDIFDEYNQELNRKPHRISARLVVAGLWSKFADATGNRAWIECALGLAEAVGPEIERYEYYNQMIDVFGHPSCETTDGEAACYALEGLAPLYEATRDPFVLSLCKKAAAFGVAWTYFFDLPNAYRGIARGGQCCRMPDFPLLYPVGPAKAVEPFLILHRATGDSFYERLAREMVFFISQYQHDCPDQPWDRGAVHAIDQRNGCFWGPNLAGQVDSGVSSGNSLAALELWLQHHVAV